MAIDIKTQQIDMIAAIIAGEGHSLLTAPNELYRQAVRAVCDGELTRPIVH